MKHPFVACGIALSALARMTGAAAACWEPVVETGALSFVSTQAGAPLEGTFREFSGEICLDPAGPAQSWHIELRVDTASVDTMLPELDEVLKGPDFLDAATWPEAVFVSDEIRALGDNHYKVTGKFTLHDVTRTLDVPFNLIPGKKGEGPRLEGGTTIRRLDYDVGRGEWSDTRWVGDEVKLKFSVTLK